MMPEPESLSATSTIAELQRWAQRQLPGDEARRESEMLLGHALQRDRAWLFAHADARIDPASRRRFEHLLAERRRGTPIAHLLGRWGFWTLDLAVTADTLIPRVETELLVETALECVPRDAAARIADLGTGSGAIALALASERPRSRVVATDASATALAVARDNARRNEIDNVEFRAGHWYLALGSERYDLIASNPPYIADDDAHLGRGDLRFEPRTALASGRDGLDAIRELAAGACAHLRAAGWLLLEHGHEQGAAVRELLEAAGLQEVHTRRDLEQRDRVTLGRAPA
jgi:release factor glutamine methyltransferase